MYKKYFDLNDDSEIKGKYWDSDDEDDPPIKKDQKLELDIDNLFITQVGKDKFYKQIKNFVRQDTDQKDEEKKAIMEYRQI